MSIFGVSLHSYAVVQRTSYSEYTRTHTDMRKRAEKDRLQAEEALEKLISSVELIRDSGTRVRQYMHLFFLIRLPVV